MFQNLLTILNIKDSETQQTISANPVKPD